MKTVGLFFDISCFYYKIRKKFGLDAKLDYSILLEHLTKDEIIFRALAYGIQKDDDPRKFQASLKLAGYTPKYIQNPTYNDAEGNTKFFRINRNVDITMDALKLQAKMDRVYLGTTDYNMAPLVEGLMRDNVECVLVGCGIPRQLKELATHWVEIDETHLKQMDVSA